MISFWVCAALLLAAALAFVLPALLKAKSGATSAMNNATQANLSILRSQLALVDADFNAGNIDIEQLTLAKKEIERRALDEENAPEPSTVPKNSVRTAWGLGLSVPLIALGIYGFLGNIQALDPANLLAATQNEPTPEQIEVMVAGFAARLASVPADQPADPKAWEMLARSYAAMQKFPQASTAYKRAVELNPGNAQILADYADVLAMLQGQSMQGEPTQMFERALVLDPNNIKALALAGSAAFERKNFSQAIAFWQKASQIAPPESEFSKSLTSSIEEARAASGSAQVATKSVPAPAAISTGIQGIASLAPALKDKVAPDDTVFIFARAASSPNSPRMPLAILKRKASELPIAFKLDDTMAMSDALKLSRFEQVVVGVRISKSGNALPQSGDLTGQTDRVGNTAAQLTVIIENTQP